MRMKRKGSSALHTLGSSALELLEVRVDLEEALKVGVLHQLASEGDEVANIAVKGGAARCDDGGGILVERYRGRERRHRIEQGGRQVRTQCRLEADKIRESFGDLDAMDTLALIRLQVHLNVVVGVLLAVRIDRAGRLCHSPPAKAIAWPAAA